MKAISRIRLTKLFEPKHTELIQMSKEVAIALIADLVRDLANNGASKIVFRKNSGDLVVFQVKDE